LSLAGVSPRPSIGGRVILSILAVTALAVAASAALAVDTLEFTDVEAQTRQFIDYHNATTLTPEQEAVKREALSALPAPCCSDNSAYTCCCPCNMAKANWGLAAYLIVEHGANAEQVRDTVAEWIEFINPDGFSGDVCYTSGGCMKSFRDNGCGGMSDRNVAY
jgi:hypothetical protein